MVVGRPVIRGEDGVEASAAGDKRDGDVAKATCLIRRWWNCKRGGTVRQRHVREGR